MAEPGIGKTKKLCASYDLIASEYARRIYGELANKPFDRDWLDRFSDRVRPHGWTCDLGCGPGHIARYLCDRGVRAFGLDLSRGMLLEARKLNPNIPWVQGTMPSMGIRSGSLAGIAAFYSIIHLEAHAVVLALGEMRRVLRDNGLLLLAFHLGTEVVHTSNLWGYTVDLDATHFSVQQVVADMTEAGFVVEDAAERGPYAPEVEYQSRRGYVLGAK